MIKFIKERKLKNKVRLLISKYVELESRFRKLSERNTNSESQTKYLERETSKYNTMLTDLEGLL